MKKYIEWVIDHPVAVIAVITCITVILGLGVPKIGFDSSLESMMPNHDPQYILYEKTKEIYGNNGNFILICVSSDNALSPGFLNRINELQQDIEEYETFDKEREQQRMERLKGLSAQGSISRHELVNSFSDDPAFQRAISRKSAVLFNTRENLKPDDISRLEQSLSASALIKEKELIDLIISPLSAKDLVGENDTLSTFDLIEHDDLGRRIIPQTEEEIAEFKSRLTNNPMFERGIYARDPETGHITDFGIMLRLVDRLNEEITDEIHGIVSGYSDINIIMQGVPVIYREVNRYMQHDLRTFLPLVLLIVIIVFYLNFRSISGVVLPFISLCLSDIWIMGMMGHLGYNLTPIGISLPVLMIAVGSSYSIHILNQYLIDSDRITESNRLEGLRESMSHISLTVILAGLTTFVGFFMLITNQVSAIKEWGVFSAVGILFAVLISTSLLPAVFSLMPHGFIRTGVRPGQARENRDRIDAILDFFIRLIHTRPRALLAVTGVILVISVIGAFRIEPETAVTGYFKKHAPILGSSRQVGEKFGGAYGLSILLDSGEQDGVKDPEFLRFIDRFREWLELDENIDLNIGRSDSFTDFVKTMHMAMYNNDHAYYSIPDRRIDIESYISIFNGDDDNDDGRIDAFEPYVDQGFRTVNIFARIWEKEGKEIGTTAQQHIVNRIEAYLDNNLPEGWTYQTTGVPKNVIQLGRYVVIGQYMSLLFSLAVVGIIVLLLFRNRAAGLFALIPISIAVIVNFGVMGWVGIKLDIATAIIASITIGIGIDDTIHFLNTFRHFRSLGLSIDDTIDRTLRISGRAIIYTSLALIFGFIIFVFSNFKPVLFFGILATVTMIATTLGALLILPSTIRVTGVHLSVPTMKGKFWDYLDVGRLFRLDKN